MAKVNLVIADSDRNYIERLVDFLTERNKHFNISCFSEIEAFEAHITAGLERMDVIIFSEDMYSETVQRCRASLKIVLDSGNLSHNFDIPTINKYQSAIDFSNQILTMYTEKTGDSSVIEAESYGNTQVISIYSPVGGSGKTTVAISLAKELVRYDKSVLYLNLEGVSSVKEIFKGSGIHNMSEVFLAAKTPRFNVGLKVMQCKEQDYDTGIDFINAPECSTEYGELLPKEIRRIVEETKGLDEYDYIVVDMNSGYNEDALEILEVSDSIIIPYILTDSSVNKMKVFAEEININSRFDGLVKKMFAVENMSSNISYANFGKIQVKAYFNDSPMLRNLNNILYSNLDGMINSVINAIY